MTSLFSRASLAICVAVLILVLGSPFGGTPLSAQSPGKWKPLFNGKDLTGWTVLAGGGRRGAGSGRRPGAGDAAGPSVDESRRPRMEG